MDGREGFSGPLYQPRPEYLTKLQHSRVFVELDPSYHHFLHHINLSKKSFWQTMPPCQEKHWRSYHHRWTMIAASTALYLKLHVLLSPSKK